MAGPQRECPKYKLLSRLLTYGKEEVLRRVVDKLLSPNELEKAILRVWTGGNMETQLYRRLISQPASSREYDISLLAQILQFSTELMPHESDEWNPVRHEYWDNASTINIARLRDYQSQFKKLPIDCSLSDAKFEEDWAKISRTIIALAGSELGEGERHVLAISEMKSSQEFVKIRQRLEHLEGMVIPMSYGTGQR